MKIKLASLEDTRKLASVVAKFLACRERESSPCAPLLLLSGELGAGKTTFTRFLMTELGSRTPVSSPTFVLSHEYLLPSGALLEHWDLFRLQEAPVELVAGDLGDSRGTPGARGWKIVEWGDKFPELRALGLLGLEFRIDSEGKRSATVDVLSPESAIRSLQESELSQDLAKAGLLAAATR